MERPKDTGNGGSPETLIHNELKEVNEGVGVRASSFPRQSHILHTFSSEPQQNARPSIFSF